MDCIEVGYLDAHGSTQDSTKFSNLAVINTHLSSLQMGGIDDFPKNIESQNNAIPEFLAMINLGDFDIATLPPKHTTLLNGIRLSFHKEGLLAALEAGRRILDLGYQLYFQPMITK